MSDYKVTLVINGVTDTTEVEAASALEAAFYAGQAIGAGMLVDNPTAAAAYRLHGLGYVQASAEETIRETMSSLTVEEL